MAARAAALLALVALALVLALGSAGIGELRNAVAAEPAGNDTHAEPIGNATTGGTAEALGDAAAPRSLRAVAPVRSLVAQAGSQAPAATVSYALRYGKTWSDTQKNGKGAGYKTKRMSALRVSLKSAEGGSVKYRVRGMRAGVRKWGAWASNGDTAVTRGGAIDGVQVKISGKLTRSLRVCYRVHVLGSSWRPWVANGKTSSAGRAGARIDLIQVKLVKRGEKAVKNRSKTVRVGVACYGSSSEGKTCDYVRRCGMEVVRIRSAKADISGLDGLVLPGSSHDVTPSLYGEKRSPRTKSPIIGRDRLFIKLVKRFAKAEKPVLGLCGGEQHLNVALGGTLRQHIGWHGGYRKVTVAKNSWLYGLFGTSEATYHSHHQAVGKAAPSVMITQRDAKDGCVECIEGITLPVYGTQWHPEAMGSRGVAVGHLFKAECIAYRS